MIEVRAATLLSKYFSESAKIVDQIFSELDVLCESQNDLFVCVLIDEIESIALSREETISGAEVHDALRATNALLTGIDRTRRHTNLVFICTSNLPDNLDAAFLDRCTLRVCIATPSRMAQYKILSNQLQNLMKDHLPKCGSSLCTYVEAKHDLSAQAVTPGSRLLQLLNTINAKSSGPGKQLQISARSLSKLPQTAILRYCLEDQEYTLDMVLDCLEQHVESEKPKEDENLEAFIPPNRDTTNDFHEIIRLRRTSDKITIQLVVDDKFDTGRLHKIVDKLPELQDLSRDWEDFVVV